MTTADQYRQRQWRNGYPRKQGESVKAKRKDFLRYVREHKMQFKPREVSPLADKNRELLFALFH